MPGTGRAAKGLRDVVRFRFVSFVVLLRGHRPCRGRNALPSGIVYAICRHTEASAEGRV